MTAVALSQPISLFVRGDAPPAPFLEVISRGASRYDGVPPILLVHGAWHGAWCWDRGFMDRLADAGHEVHALSLRGHGNSSGRERLRTTRVRDYVADVAKVAASLREPPLLVGHSMGAFVIQKYLEGRHSPGAAFLAPMPPTGIASTAVRLMRSDPVGVLLGNLTLSLSPVVSTPDKARRLFLSPGMPQDEVDDIHANLQDEAYLAYLDMLVLDLAKPATVTAPVAVFGAERDAVFSRSQLDSTARAYGTTPEVFPDMAHDMMLERGWEAVADRISDWAYHSASTRADGQARFAASM